MVLKKPLLDEENLARLATRVGVRMAPLHQKPTKKDIGDKEDERIYRNF